MDHAYGSGLWIAKAFGNGAFFINPFLKKHVLRGKARQRYHVYIYVHIDHIIIYYYYHFDRHYHYYCCCYIYIVPLFCQIVFTCLYKFRSTKQLTKENTDRFSTFSGLTLCLCMGFAVSYIEYRLSIHTKYKNLHIYIYIYIYKTQFIIYVYIYTYN